MIEVWIEEFKKAWLAKNIRAVTNLFTEDVEYWETPFQKIAPRDLNETWKAVLDQENISLVVEPIVSDGLHHTLRWEVAYERGGDAFQWAGVYIIELSDEGKCNYFYQVGEQA